MLTDIPFLPESQRQELANLVTVIAKAVSPEKIICFGYRSTVSRDWSCFLSENGTSERVVTTYDLLIIPNPHDKRPDHEILQIIEQQTEPLTCHVTAIVHPLNAVNELLDKGARFFTTLYQKGVLLYNGHGLAFNAGPEALTANLLKSRAEQSWNREFIKAQRFYRCATHCLGEGWPELSVFMLHQAVQHGCMALLRAVTGYRSQTHNLARLLALTENFSMLPASVFPTITPQESEFFDLLRNAYSDARYKVDYTVPQEKATILAKRVKRLLEVFEQLYRRHLETLIPPPDLSFPLTISDEK